MVVVFGDVRLAEGRRRRGVGVSRVCVRVSEPGGATQRARQGEGGSGSHSRGEVARSGHSVIGIRLTRLETPKTLNSVDGVDDNGDLLRHSHQ